MPDRKNVFFYKIIAGKCHGHGYWCDHWRCFLRYRNTLTDNFINPILNVLTGGATYTLKDVSGFASSFVSSVINFVIMAFILFCLLKAVNKITSIGAKKEEEPAPTTKVCPFCRSEIDIEATRCPHCTSILNEEKKEEL